MIPREMMRRIQRIQIHTSHVVDDLLAGQWHSAFKGRGIEFEEVRPYQVGDDVRTIDWNVTARAGVPFEPCHASALGPPAELGSPALTLLSWRGLSPPGSVLSTRLGRASEHSPPWRPMCPRGFLPEHKALGLSRDVGRKGMASLSQFPWLCGRTPGLATLSLVARTSTAALLAAGSTRFPSDSLSGWCASRTATIARRSETSSNTSRESLSYAARAHDFWWPHPPYRNSGRPSALVR